MGLAEVAYQRNELASALTHLDDGIPLCRQLVYTQPLATGLATLAWARQAQGDTAGALDLMRQAARVTRDVGAANVLNPVPVQRVRLLLARGDVGAATRDACPQGYVRVFVDVGTPMRTLLGRLVAVQGSPGSPADVPFDCLARLQRAFTATPALGGDTQSATAVASMVESLTVRAKARSWR